MTDVEPSPQLPRATTVHEAAHGPEGEGFFLVVEMPNDNPWYDVHPILQGYVDDLLG